VNIQLLKQCVDTCISPEEVAEFMRPHTLEWLQIKNVLSAGAIPCGCATVYRVPLLSPQFCDWLVGRAVHHRFTRNDQEEENVQIDESVLKDTDAVAYHAVLASAFPMINACAALIYQALPSGISSIQLASYSPDKVYGGNWHHDRTSDMSVVVSLNPDDFEGGGTRFRTGPDSYVDIPPLPKGHAVIFPGKHLHHYGLPVTKGRRMLLVFWLELFAQPAGSTDTTPVW